MKPVVLDKRPCQLGPTINTRREKHGTTNVPASDFQLNAMLLTKPELDKLVGSGFWNSRYETRSGGQPPKPAWDRVTGEKFGMKLEADLTLAFLSDSLKPIEITGAKVGKLDFEYQIGGLTACYFTVSTAQDDIDVNKLRQHMDAEISVAITFREPKPEKPKPAKDDEPELDLAHPNGDDGSSPARGGDDDEDDTGEATEGGDEVGPSTRAAAKKVARKSGKAKAKR